MKSFVDVIKKWKIPSLGSNIVQLENKQLLIQRVHRTHTEYEPVNEHTIVGTNVGNMIVVDIVTSKPFYVKK